jgi:MarR-like DNA-binding transcriptional regulator SgrR of sgrS sRNA
MKKGMYVLTAKQKDIIETFKGGMPLKMVADCYSVSVRYVKNTLNQHDFNNIEYQRINGNESQDKITYAKTEAEMMQEPVRDFTDWRALTEKYIGKGGVIVF